MKIIITGCQAYGNCYYKDKIGKEYDITTNEDGSPFIYNDCYQTCNGLSFQIYTHDCEIIEKNKTQLMQKENIEVIKNKTQLVQKENIEVIKNNRWNQLEL
jgi:hypothetical protein